ncbi:carbohydrate ABC transporter permease [Halorarum halobium]|uniref:carbohydrate ABC transporter permease n=1 Tax=Halorarum halobium TaxID=3075121 RepID=UPI0028A9F379|nr:carbohydrate ABC transporter permease [Halobaculum sp. XH14]
MVNDDAQTDGGRSIEDGSPLATVLHNTRSAFAMVFKRQSIEQSIWEKLAFYAGIVGLLVFTLFPFYVMLLTSITSSAELYSIPFDIVPETYTLDHYSYVLLSEDFPFLTYFTNSFIVASVTSGLAVIVATFGGYSFARLDYPGRKLIARLVLVVYLFGGIVLVVPLFRVIAALGLIDTLGSLMITYLVIVLPLSLYLLGNYFRSIPEEIEEAALVDGYSRLETIFYITLPLSAPAIVAVFLFAFIIAWNDYLFASIFLDSPEKYTLIIGVEYLNVQYTRVWGRIMAASVATSAPIIVFFLYLEKYLVEGLTTGGVEG